MQPRAHAHGAVRPRVVDPNRRDHRLRRGQRRRGREPRHATRVTSGTETCKQLAGNRAPPRPRRGGYRRGAPLHVGARRPRRRRHRRSRPAAPPGSGCSPAGWTCSCSDCRRIGTRLLIATMPGARTGPARPVQLAPDRAARSAPSPVSIGSGGPPRARHPEAVGIVDLAHFVCPDGPPCPRIRDGFAPRAIDGYHYTPRGLGVGACAGSCRRSSRPVGAVTPRA